ncbi:MAG TPA: 3-phosphoshikimate 1-carboxyvinyltransferase [Alphaproteobacteria bacterium]|nr:3-phosphoshikimate 1-carboxyvinyltransferase [Alphaproteobacteria bacterium]
MAGLVSYPLTSVSGLSGVARVPGDKSISHRSLMIGALASGETHIMGLLEGEDVLHTADALRAMGVVIRRPEKAGGLWHVTGVGDKGLQQPDKEIYLGNSGTSTRLLMGLVAGYPISVTFTGDASLSRRPMGRVITPLTEMGAKIEAADGGKLPLTVFGSRTLKPIHYTLPVASAQVKSAIILAGLHAADDTTAIEPLATRDHTERMLTFFGADISSVLQEDGTHAVTITPCPTLKGQHVIVPADPSSAGFATVAALITPGSDIVLPQVSINPLRTGLYTTLIEMGANITFENECDLSGEPTADMRVRHSALKGVTVPEARVPSMIDEFPILSIAAAFAEGATYMSGLEELRVKESDRLAVMATGLKAAGVDLEMGENSLLIRGSAGTKPPGGCLIETHLDHRIAMSFLILGMATIEPVMVDDAETINTSFPGFADLMNILGADIRPQAEEAAASA